MLLTSYFENRASLENPAFSLSDPDAWRNHFESGMLAETDQSINVDKALTLSPVWMAIKMISGDCAKIPLNVCQRRLDGGKDVDRSHAVQMHISRDGLANEETTAIDFWRQHYTAALLFENAYIWIDTNGFGDVVGLYHLLPDRTHPKRINGKLYYLSEINGQMEAFHHTEVIHLRGLCWDGMQAPSLVSQARHDFGMALASRKFTSKFFANGAHLGGVIQTPEGYSKKATDNIEEGIKNRGKDPDKMFRTMVLRDGVKFFATTVDPKRAQLPELDEAQVRHVARWYMLQPSMLGVKESVSYNSEEAAKQNYFDTTLSYWLRPTEAQCGHKLLTEDERRRGYIVRAQIDALKWADTKTKMEVASRGVLTGIISPDEGRSWFGKNPRDDGQGGKFLQPVNMQMVGDEDELETGEEPDGDANDSAGDRSDVTQDFHRRLFENTVARCVRRLLTHAERAEKKDGLPAFLSSMRDQHGPAIDEILFDVVNALNSIRTDGETAAVIEVRDYIIESFRHSGGDAVESIPASTANVFF